MSFDGYDSWRTTPPDDTHNEHEQEDALEQEHADAMQALQDWLSAADEHQLNAAERLFRSERETRQRRYADKLRLLSGKPEAKPRAPRSDKGKPRAPKGRPADPAGYSPGEYEAQLAEDRREASNELMRGVYASTPANEAAHADPDPFEVAR
jgi:hypothetical protein